MDFFDRPENTSGALTSNLSALPTQLQELISANVLLIFIVLVNIVSSSALAIAYGWKLGLVIVFGGLPPIVMSGYLRIRLETRIEGINSERFADSASLASEAVRNSRSNSSLFDQKWVTHRSFMRDLGVSPLCSVPNLGSQDKVLKQTSASAPKTVSNDLFFGL